MKIISIYINLLIKNHPSSIWARQNPDNYSWLYHLFVELCKEYTYRYNKQHTSFTKLAEPLSAIPKNIPWHVYFSQPPQAMPDQYKCADSITAYRNYYKGEKAKFATWKNRPVPSWFLNDE